VSNILTIINDENSSELRPTELLGQQGEALAAQYLIENGYRIALTNFKVPVGRNSQGAQVTGEIDIVALDGEILCFVEVKTRRSAEFTPVITAVDLRKQRQITRTARIYRRIFRVFEMPYRFDVVTVLMPRTGEPEIELSRNFWDESKFRKHSWHREMWRDLF
jgi:putative endonuclease